MKQRSNPIYDRVANDKWETIETYHSAIRAHIDLLCAYTQNKEYKRWIVLASLRTPSIQPRMVPKIWYDEFNNSVEFTPYSANIKFNDLSAPKKHFHANDLFHCVPIRKIVLTSKKTFFCFGEDDGFYGVMSFYGIDNKIRSYYFDNGNWARISNLYLGDLMGEIEDCHHECISTNSKILPVEDEKSFIIRASAVKKYQSYLPEEIKKVFSSIWKKENV
jgi:hypothetical protein